MGLGSLFEIASWTIAVAVPYAVLWWGTTWIQKRWLRISVQFLVVPVLTVAAALPMRVIVGISIDRGCWKCTICGASEYQVRLAGLRIAHSVRSDEIHQEFVDRYTSQVHEPHRHDWGLAVGCHFFPSAVACSFDAGGAYFSAVPRIPSAAVAASMARRMLRASSSERLDLIRGFPKAEMDEPFDSLRRGESMMSEQFAGAYSSWLQFHPEWR